MYCVAHRLTVGFLFFFLVCPPPLPPGWVGAHERMVNNALAWLQEENQIWCFERIRYDVERCTHMCCGKIIPLLLWIGLTKRVRGMDNSGELCERYGVGWGYI
jgi:hypothetical protein